MTSASEQRAVPTRLLWVVPALLPLIVVALLRWFPKIDPAWENHPAHFWLVLLAASLATGLGYAVSVAARRRVDARLLFISLAFIASAGFLGLHALATPGVLVGPTPGFELATPIGLLLGGLFVSISAIEMGPAASLRVIHRSSLYLAILLLVMVVWAIASLVQIYPLDNPLQEEELNGWQGVLGGLGVVLYAIGALGYLRIYRRRRARFLFAVSFAFALLAEAMVVIAFAQNWHISWWEWHTLMLGAFALIGLVARHEWREERFSPLYLDETLAGVKEASILFADLAGYTNYSEHSSTSEVVGMLNTYFAPLVPMLQKSGGDVHQIIGDELMVVFNKEGDQPDHALLASQAGLQLQELAGAIAGAHPSWPRFRVGINSGEVAAGVIGGPSGHRKHGLVGDTVNLAARLQAQAPVGGVVIGTGTYQRLPGSASVERLPELHLKGKEEPVTAYLLTAIAQSGRRD